MLRADRHGWTPRQLSIDACLPIAAPTRTARNVGTPTAFVGKHVEYGGIDGARTRDLRRDRPSVYLRIPAVVPTFSAPGQTYFDANSERPITGIPGRSCAAGSIEADGQALPGCGHAERPVQA